MMRISHLCANSPASTQTTRKRLYVTAYRLTPIKLIRRVTGAMNVYSSVPSHRSNAIDIEISLKSTERKLHSSTPIVSVRVSRGSP